LITWLNSTEPQKKPLILLIFKTVNTLTGDIEPVIQNNDLLSISVSSLNPEDTIIFNTPNHPSNTTWGGSALFIEVLKMKVTGPLH
jgi:polysaccharide export outer membrane protein